MRSRPLLMLLLAPLATLGASNSHCSVEARFAGSSQSQVSPCLVRDSAGYVILARSELAGAVSAEIVVEDRRLPVRFVVADNPYADLVEVWVPLDGRPLTPTPLSDLPPSEGASYLAPTGDRLTVQGIKDQPGIGTVLLLTGGKEKHPHIMPVLDSSGVAVALLVCHEVNGAEVHYAVPMMAVQEMKQGPLWTLEEWNSRNKLEQASARELQRAIGYFWYGDAEGAKFYLDKYLELQPEDPQGWFLMGFAEGKTGNSRRKIAAYQRAVELNPSFAEAHYSLGIAFVLAGEMEQAEQVHEKLMALDEALANRLAQFLHEVHVDKLPEKAPQPPKRGNA